MADTREHKILTLAVHVHTGTFFYGEALPLTPNQHKKMKVCCKNYG